MGAWLGASLGPLRVSVPLGGCGPSRPSRRHLREQAVRDVTAWLAVAGPSRYVGADPTATNFAIADPAVGRALARGERAAAAEAIVRHWVRVRGNFPETFTAVSLWARALARSRWEIALRWSPPTAGWRQRIRRQPAPEWDR